MLCGPENQRSNRSAPIRLSSSLAMAVAKFRCESSGCLESWVDKVTSWRLIGPLFDTPQLHFRSNAQSALRKRPFYVFSTRVMRAGRFISKRREAILRPLADVSNHQIKKLLKFEFIPVNASEFSKYTEDFHALFFPGEAFGRWKKCLTHKRDQRCEFMF